MRLLTYSLYITLSLTLAACATADIGNDPGGFDSALGSDSSLPTTDADPDVDAGPFVCAPPLTECNGDCVNTSFSEQHCGDCDEPCAGSCENGECIIPPTCNPPNLECDGNCINPQTDERYCGASGTCLGADAGVLCDNNEECISGQCECVFNCAYEFHHAFVSGELPTTLCPQWQVFLGGLVTSYSSVTIFGTNDQAGITCTDSVKASEIAQGLRTRTEFFVECDGHTWSWCDRQGGELWVDAPTLCNGNNCPNPGYIIRPCWESDAFGGVNTATCVPVTQEMGLRFTP